jgi:soluble lytic murein transglycosylase-like protein
VLTDGRPSQVSDPNLVLAADEPSGAPPADDGTPEGDTQLAKAPGTAKPKQPAEPSPPKPDPVLAQQNRETLRNTANTLPNPDWKEKPLPDNWETMLPKTVLDALDKAEKDYGIPRELMAALMWKESNFNEKAEASKKAQGKGLVAVGNSAIDTLIKQAQARHDTDREAELKKWRVGDSRMEAGPAISMAAEYLRYCYAVAGRSWVNAVAAYTFGDGGIQRFVDGQARYDHSQDGVIKTRWQRLNAYLRLVFNGDETRFDRLQPTP